MIHVGDIVRVTEDSMHFDMLQEQDIPLEGLCIKIDPHEQLERYLVEFSREDNVLHDGGEGDEVDCRYWMDKLEVIEANPNFPLEAWPVAPAPAPPQPRQFNVPPPPHRRAVPQVYFVDDQVPEEAQVRAMERYAQWINRAEEPNDQR